MRGGSQSKPIITDGGSVFQTDYQNEPLVPAIVRALSAVEGCRVEDVPTLNNYIETDSMNRLMKTARHSNQDVTVDVTVEEYKVSVDSDGTISIREPGQDIDTSESE